jgi:predicted nuclease of predicted toxin-antitoxin system
VTYLFDNNISPRLARMLRELGVDARALRDEFPHGVKDPEVETSGVVSEQVGRDRQIR